MRVNCEIDNIKTLCGRKSDMAKKIDVTDKITQAPDLEGSLKAYDWMMRQNRGSIVEEGNYGQKTIKTIKVSKK